MIAESRRCVFRIAVGMTTLAIPLLLASAGTAAGARWIVDDSCGTGVDYTTIQAAVDAASAGDTIEVASGTYHENVDVYKQLTLIGDGADVVTVEAADASDHVFEVTVDRVNISGFAVTGATKSYSSAGIYLSGADHCNISNNIASNNSVGIYIGYSSNNTLSNNNCSNNGCYDICIVWRSSSNMLQNNTGDICLSHSSNNTLSNNNCSNKDDGIFLDWSSNNTLVNNTVNSNNFGIHLLSSSNNTLTDNTFIDNGLVVSNSYGNIVKNNTVNGKPLIYFEGTSNFTIQSAGQVILVKCTNITVENLNISNVSVGIELLETCDCVIANNTASNNWCGVYPWGSSNNTFINNNCSNNGVGINMWYSSNNTLVSNTVNSNRGYGIYSSHSSNNTFIDNNLIDNGIYLSSSSNNTLADNVMVNDGIVIYGKQLQHWNTHVIHSNNTVNGKPVYYWKNKIIGTVPQGAGQVILANCSNIVMENQTLNNSSVGIELGFSNNNTITNNTALNSDNGIEVWVSNNNTFTKNTCSNNDNGIRLWHSINNMLTSNAASNNDYDGIYLKSSSNNSIYLNNFIDNSQNAYSYRSSNFWNSTEPITYTYNGNTYKNYLGNYWDDYTDIDADNDGIWDHPRPIDSDSDFNPLVEPFGNYLTPVSPKKTVERPFFQSERSCVEG